MMVKIYGMQQSVYTRRVIAACEELGIAYELVKVDLLTGQHKAPEHLAKQPFARLPAIEDIDDKDGSGSVLLHMFESSAICRYLAAAYRPPEGSGHGGGGSGSNCELMPQDPRAAAVVDNWMEVGSNYFNHPAMSVIMQLVVLKWFGVTKEDCAIVNKGLEDLQQYIMVEGGVTTFLDAHPCTKDWWQRCSARPAWRKVASGEAVGERPSAAAKM